MVVGLGAVEVEVEVGAVEGEANVESPTGGRLWRVLCLPVVLVGLVLVPLSLSMLVRLGDVGEPENSLFFLEKRPMIVSYVGCSG